MCGLAAMMRLDGCPVDPETVNRMADAMRHRGPDDEGTFVHGVVGFGFRRLAILDLSPAGHQPMTSTDGRYVIIFNGEIYNYVELRRELEALGYRFRSSGDTEVLLNAYMAWGKECLAKLNGMWAFLIYDTHQYTVFGSRDRFGVKPLFYYRTDDFVLFASEIKGILASGYYTSRVNWRTTAQFLIEHRLEGVEETFFADILQVAPGMCFTIDRDGQFHQWRYWSLLTLPAVADENPPARFRELFEDAVRIRLRSDVALGVALSGGMDSTSIICAMARLNGIAQNGHAGQLNAFAYMPPQFDESQYIAKTIEQTHAQLHRIPLDSEHLIEKLNTCLWFQDEPVHSWSAVVGYEIMSHAARTGVKVILGGQGADETIGGYFNYFPNYWASLLKTHGLHKVKAEIATYTHTHGGNRHRLFVDLLGQVTKSRLARFATFRTLARWRRATALQKNAWFLPELSAALPDPDYDNDQELETALYRSVTCDPLPLYLRIEDRNSMARSVEARLPFMDYRLVSYTWKLPAEWRLRGQWNKFVQREAMRGQIPETVRSRTDKMGWPVPDQQLFRAGVRTHLLELLDSPVMRDRGIYNVAQMKADLVRTDETDFPKWREALDIVQFETWYRQKIRAQLPAPALAPLSSGGSKQEKPGP